MNPVLRILLICTAGCAMLIVIPLTACVGCTALLISAANEYDIDRQEVQAQHKTDLQHTLHWLESLNWPESLPEKSQAESELKPTSSPELNQADAIVAVLREDEQESGPDKHTDVLKRFAKVKKTSSFIWNNYGWADLTIDNVVTTVITHKVEVNGESYLICIDNPELLSASRKE